MESFNNIEKNNSPYIEYFDGDLIQIACEQLMKKGKMFKQYDQYYFEITADLGMKANQNFTCQELLELAEEYKKLIE